MTHVEDRHSCVSSLSKPRHLTALRGPGVQSHGPEVHSQACSPSVTHHTALTVVFCMPFPAPLPCLTARLHGRPGFQSLLWTVGHVAAGTMAGSLLSLQNPGQRLVP